MAAEAIALFRSLLRESKRFTNYNFREHALRRVREEFRANAAVTDAAALQQLLARGREQLALVRRQATISELYPQQTHVLESRKRA